MENSLTQIIVQALGVTGTVATLVIISSGAAFLFFRFFGKNWIENKFQESLKRFEHEQQKELERLKAEIDNQLDRARKTNDKEFSVLPEIWRLMLDAQSQIASFSSPVQFHLDVRRLSDEEIQRRLVDDGLAQWEVNKILEADNREKEYRDIFHQSNAKKTSDKFNEYNRFLLFNAIFLTQENKDCFLRIRDKLREVFHSYANLGYDRRHSVEEYEKRENLLKEVEKLRYEVEGNITKALSSSIGQQ